MTQLTLFSSKSPSQQNWTMISDQVMGGVSQGQMTVTQDGVNLSGKVSLANNGGFIQIQWPLNRTVERTELAQYQGVFIEWSAQHEQTLDLLIKSTQLWMPWQSFRAKANVTPNWQTVYIPFEAFEPYRTQTRLKPQRITTFAVLAGGQAMDVNVSVRQFGLYQ